MRAWIADVLSQMKSKQQLQGMLYDLCRPYGEVVATDISCDAPDAGQLTCRIRMADRPAASSAAHWLGTTLQDNDMIVLEYQAPGGFTS